MNIIVLDEKSRHDRWTTTHQLAHKMVDRCITDSAKYLKNPMTLLCAEYLFENQAAHQCYWNNRFCIAVMCDMWQNSQRLAAWCSVSNGINGYWEWTTHSGYDMVAVLKSIDIVPADFVAPNGGKSYCVLDGRIAAKLAEKFDLPTSHFGTRRQLTERDEREREYFKSKYPHVHVL